MKELQEYIRGKRVAFVGMAPVIEGKKLGSFIDSFDIVFRTNVFPIPEGYTEDYGKKCDVISMLRSSQIKPDVFKSGCIQWVMHYRPVISSPLLKYFYVTVPVRNQIKQDIIRVVGKNPGHGTTGINITNIVVNGQPKEYMMFGVTGYQDKDGKVVDHFKGTKHYIDYFKMSPEKKYYSLERHPSHKLTVQNDYLRYLLRKGIIKMDEYSKEYFR